MVPAACRRCAVGLCPGRRRAASESLSNCPARGLVSYSIARHREWRPTWPLPRVDLHAGTYPTATKSALPCGAPPARELSKLKNRNDIFLPAPPGVRLICTEQHRDSPTRRRACQSRLHRRSVIARVVRPQIAEQSILHEHPREVSPCLQRPTFKSLFESCFRVEPLIPRLSNKPRTWLMNFAQKVHYVIASAKSSKQDALVELASHPSRPQQT